MDDLMADDEHTHTHTHSYPQYNREKEVAAFVDDLLADDEDEAEVPVRAYRRPAIKAAAVSSKWCGVKCICGRIDGR